MKLCIQLSNLHFFVYSNIFILCAEFCVQWLRGEDTVYLPDFYKRDITVFTLFSICFLRICVAKIQKRG